MQENNVFVEEVVEFGYTQETNGEVVEVAETFASNSDIKHNTLSDRDALEAHPISAIEGLEARLKTIEDLKTVFSNNGGLSEYYLWADGNPNKEARTGYFVTFAENTTSIKICTSSDEDVIGVTVPEGKSGFIGGQSADGRDYKYGLVALIGNVEVRRTKDVSKGDYVIPNILGMAQKSFSDTNTKVPYHQIITITDAEFYTLNHTPNADRIAAYILNDDDTFRSQVTVIRTSDEGAKPSGRDIVISGNAVTVELGSSAYQAGDRIQIIFNYETDSGAGYKVVDIYSKSGVDYAKISLIPNGNMLARTKDEINGLLETVNTINNNITIAVNTANEALSLGSSGTLTSDTLEKLDKVNKIEDDASDALEIAIASRDYSYEAQKQADAAVTSAEKLKTEAVDKANETWEELKDVEDDIVAIKKDVLEYTVGEYSQAYNLTFNQVKKALGDGCVYVPTITHSEEYQLDVEYIIQTFTRGYSYTWDGTEFRWIEASDVVIGGRGNVIKTYWYTGEEVIADSVYNKETLYMRQGDTWVAVASVNDNTSSRIVNAIYQTSNSTAMEIANVKGDLASFRTEVGDNYAKTDSIVAWKNALAAVTEKADDNEAAITSLSRFAAEVSGEGKNLGTNAPTGTFYMTKPEWDSEDGKWVFSGSSQTTPGYIGETNYCYAENSENTRTYYYYEVINNDWYRFEKGISETVAALTQQANSQGATIGMMANHYDENGQLKSASVVAAINARGESEALINADNINLSGKVTIGDLADDAKASMVVSTEIKYGHSNDTENKPTDYPDNTPQWQEGKYIWQKTITTYADNHTELTEVCIQGAKGADGTSVSIKGNAYVKDVVVSDEIIGQNYVLYSDESCTVQITAPSDSDSYLVNGYLFVHSEKNNENEFTCAGKIQGPQGKDGAAGITKVYKQYCFSESNTTAPDEGWTASIAASNWTKGKHLWVRDHYIYADQAEDYGTPVLDLSFNSIAQWAKDNDITQINGANIATGSIDADRVKVVDLSAFKATIGNWQILSDRIISDSTKGNERFMVALVNSDGLMHPTFPNRYGDVMYVADMSSGNSSTYTYPFMLKKDGSLRCTKADITGTVTANDGNIAGWTIEKDGLYKGDVGICSGTTASTLKDKTSPIRLFAGARRETKTRTDEIIIQFNEITGERQTLIFTPPSDALCEEIKAVTSVEFKIINGATTQDCSLVENPQIINNSISITVESLIGGDYVCAITYTYTSGTVADAKFLVLEDGTVYAEDANIAGTITAKDGKIGGWKLKKNSTGTVDMLCATNGTSGVSNGMAVSGFGKSDPVFWAGYTPQGDWDNPWDRGTPEGEQAREDWKSYCNFWVTHEGVLTAKSGQIGNWNIIPDGIYQGNSGMYAGNLVGASLVDPSSSSPVRFFAGATRKTSTWETSAQAYAEGTEVVMTVEFNPRDYGVSLVKVMSASATISSAIKEPEGVTIKTTISNGDTILVTASGGNLTKRLQYDVKITYTYETPANSKFVVLEDGSMYAKGAEISGKLTAKDGEIGGWNITESSINKDTVGIVSEDKLGYQSLMPDAKEGELSPIRFYAGSKRNLVGKRSEIKIEYNHIGQMLHSVKFDVDLPSDQANFYRFSEAKCLTPYVLHENAKHSRKVSITSGTEAVYGSSGELIGYSINETSVALLPTDIFRDNIKEIRVIDTNGNVLTKMSALYQSKGDVLISGCLDTQNATETIAVECDFCNYEEKLEGITYNIANTKIEISFKPKVENGTYNLSFEVATKYKGEVDDDETPNFMVLDDGSLYANNADIRGNITADNGVIGNLKLDNGSLISTNFRLETLLDSETNKVLSQMRFYDSENNVKTSIDENEITTPHINTESAKMNNATIGDLSFSNNTISSQNVSIQFGVQTELCTHYEASLAYNGFSSDITVNIYKGGELKQDRYFTVYWRQSGSDLYQITTVLVKAGHISGTKKVSCLFGVAAAYFDVYESTLLSFFQYDNTNLIMCSGNVVPQGDFNLGTTTNNWNNVYANDLQFTGTNGDKFQAGLGTKSLYEILMKLAGEIEKIKGEST